VAAVLVALADTTASAAELELTSRELKTILSMSPLERAPLDTTNRVDGKAAAIELGKLLFHDTRVSADGRFSCATCHDPAKNWTDGREVAEATAVGRRNTPALWNAAHNRWFFWDGRADSLWSQSLKPTESSTELNGSRLQIAHLIADDRTLSRLYKKVFGALPNLSNRERFPAVGGPQANDGERQVNWWSMDAQDRDSVSHIFANYGKAIAAFEGTITTGPAAFDVFVAELRAGKTESTAISSAAQRGLKTFVGKGNCVLCHSGPAFTNKEFHDIRVPRRPTEGPPDMGRAEGLIALMDDEFVAPGPHSDDPEGSRAQHLLYLDGDTGFRGHFKVPTLRNVALTAPYMHAGQFKTLREVVHYYSTLEGAVEPAEPSHIELLIRPFALTEQETDDLVAFLESLTSLIPP
jgi:cytochrome c peroxidase